MVWADGCRRTTVRGHARGRSYEYPNQDAQERIIGAVARCAIYEMQRSVRIRTNLSLQLHQSAAKAKRFGWLRSIKVASNSVLRGDFLAQRGLAGAMRHRVRTTRMEPASRRWIERARHFASDRQLFVSLVGVGRE